MADAVLMDEILTNLSERGQGFGDNSRALMASLKITHDSTGKTGWSIRAFNRAVHALLKEGKVGLSKDSMHERGNGLPRIVLYRSSG